MLAIRTILHPTDFSTQAASALQLACSLARDHGARLLLLNVVEPPPAVSGGALTHPAWEENKGRDWDALVKLEVPDTRVSAERQQEVGDPTDEILKVVGEKHCDLVVMGTHGRTGLRRLLMGSVAEGVVRKAPCPVITVKSPSPVAVS